MVRVDWRYGRSTPHMKLHHNGSSSRRNGWLLIAGLTLLSVLWLLYRAITQPLWDDSLPSMLVEFINLAATAVTLTLMVIWTGLWWRRGQRPLANPIALSIDELYQLSPAEFEQYTARVFRQKGYRVKLRGRSGDMGVDLELTKPDGKKAIVQCKRYKHTIGPDIVRELYGTLIHEQVAHAFLVTTAAISDSARQWAQGKPLTLIDGDTLTQIATAFDQ